MISHSVRMGAVACTVLLAILLAGCTSDQETSAAGATVEPTSQSSDALEDATAAEPTGEPLSEPGAECAELSGIVSDTTFQVADTFGLIERNPDVAVEELREIVRTTTKVTENLQGDAAVGAGQFLDGLEDLTDTTENAAGGSKVDEDAIHKAVADFEDVATSSLEPCAVMREDEGGA